MPSDDILDDDGNMISLELDQIARFRFRAVCNHRRHKMMVAGMVSYRRLLCLARFSDPQCRLMARILKLGT